MLKNYLKTTFRNLSRHKGYAFINIFGLAVGMTCCILILSYILTELSYDKYHEHTDRIYRVATDVNAGGFIAKLAISNAPLGPALKNKRRAHRGD